MKVAMICGTWPPARCGVGDYSDQLCNALSAADVVVEKIQLDNWGLKGLPAYRAALHDSDADIVHVQYPSVGYGRSYLPSMTRWLAGKRPCAVTLHEYEIFRSYRRPWFSPFSSFGARLFSRDAERAAFQCSFPSKRGFDELVPIGSNIPVSTKASDRAPGSVAFFGLFWPGKGIEAFLELAQMVRSRKDDQRILSIIGAPVAGQEAFRDEIRTAAGRLNIKLHENLNAADVADVLAVHDFSYLPFPDGADERRGSLAATLVNGCLPITRFGDATPDWMKSAFVEAKTPEEAYAIVAGDKLDEATKRDLRTASAALSQRYDWSGIAAKHIEIYEKLLK